MTTRRTSDAEGVDLRSFAECGLIPGRYEPGKSITMGQGTEPRHRLAGLPRQWHPEALQLPFAASLIPQLVRQLGPSPDRSMRFARAAIGRSRPIRADPQPPP